MGFAPMPGGTTKLTVRFPYGAVAAVEAGAGVTGTPPMVTDWMVAPAGKPVPKTVTAVPAGPLAGYGALTIL
jgi:hypothetical protein